MNILITGSAGFVGKNLCYALKNIKEGKDKTRPNLRIDEIYEYDVNTEPELLDEYCAKTDFVFNLAGVNRPQDQTEFMKGNFGFASTLLDTLKKHKNLCPVMLSSSIQASLIGRYGQSDYGKSKLAGEKLFFDYANKQVPRYLSIASRIYLENGVVPITTALWLRFVTILPTTFPLPVNDRANGAGTSLYR